MSTSASPSSCSLACKDVVEMVETTLSSFLFKESRLFEAVSKRECRAVVRESSKGATINLLVPYKVAAAPETM